MRVRSPSSLSSFWWELLEACDGGGSAITVRRDDLREMMMGLLSMLEVSGFYWAGDGLARGLKLIRFDNEVVRMLDHAKRNGGIRFDNEVVRMLDHAKRNGGSVHVFWELAVDAPIEVEVVNIEKDDIPQQPTTNPQHQP
ncbi:hypothetical protein PIB30_034273 [Stylosanthes scabra]|uniref:Uncharacterized protein n=1 Tax=Stylosanthes scabra TaxID=79078 RepID=A0ABU6YA05_9FABA|nr:hypothetical protein [Stylosanthes scabra]